MDREIETQSRSDELLNKRESMQRSDREDRSRIRDKETQFISGTGKDRRGRNYTVGDRDTEIDKEQ